MDLLQNSFDNICSNEPDADYFPDHKDSRFLMLPVNESRRYCCPPAFRSFIPDEMQFKNEKCELHPKKI